MDPSTVTEGKAKKEGPDAWGGEWIWYIHI